MAAEPTRPDTAPDARFLARIAGNAAVDAVHRALANDGSGPHDPGMEARIEKLETDVKEVKDVLQRQVLPILTRIDERLKDMPAGKEFGELKGRVSQLPTTLQLVGFVLAVLGIAGLAKYFTP